MKRAIHGVIIAAIVLLPATSRASDVELTDRELVLSISTPTQIELTYAHAFEGLLFTLGASAALDAEGASLTIGVRPLLAREADYRLIWASWAGPVIYGRDGASGGLTAVTELQSVVSIGPVRLMASPKVDFAGAWGTQDAWRARVLLSVGAGLVIDWLSAWLTADAGYTFGGYGPGAFHGSATLTLGVRFGELD